MVAPVYKSPDVFVEELPVERPPIAAAPTGVSAFAGFMGAEHDGTVLEVASFLEFADTVSGQVQSATIGVALDLFFRNGGKKAIVAGCTSLQDVCALKALERSDFDVLCLPTSASEPAIPAIVHEAAAALCERKRAIYLVDSPAGWSADSYPVEAAQAGATALLAGNSYAALYFPRLNLVPRADGTLVKSFPPSPAVAGIIARIDETRGVWKAPAGSEAVVLGVESLDVPLTDQDQGVLNPEGISCLRSFPRRGIVVWGGRTRAGQDALASEWKYVNVRRLALFLERSIAGGLQWTVFEPNGEGLWENVRDTIESFLFGLWRQGAFAGSSAAMGFFVRCDRSTISQDDIDNGRLVCQIGFAPLKPAEFVIIRIVANTAA